MEDLILERVLAADIVDEFNKLQRAAGVAVNFAQCPEMKSSADGGCSGQQDGSGNNGKEFF